MKDFSNNRKKAAKVDVNHRLLLNILGRYLKNYFLLLFVFNWDSLHARVNSHYEARSYKKKKYKKIKAYRKSV